MHTCTVYIIRFPYINKSIYICGMHRYVGFSRGINMMLAFDTGLSLDLSL